LGIGANSDFQDVYRHLGVAFICSATGLLRSSLAGD
jgi:hypothetical protein